MNSITQEQVDIGMMYYTHFKHTLQTLQTHTCTCTTTHTHAYMYMHTHVHAHTCTCTNTCTHRHMHRHYEPKHTDTLSQNTPTV